MFDFLSEKFSSIFSRITGQSHLSEANIAQALDNIQDALLQADVPYDVVETFIAEVKKEAIGKQVLKSVKPGDQLIKMVHEKLQHFLGAQHKPGVFSFQIPSTIMMMGLQGSGKTTTIAKLVHYTQKAAKQRGKKRNILLASVDFYRPAAIDQLEVLSRQVEADFYRATHENPVQAAQEIAHYAKRQGYELLFLDTAGRLHVDTAMLQELQKINELLDPKYKILVLDAMTGQESLSVARAFEQAVGFNWAVLSKMDSETRGGSAFAFRYVMQKPVQFIGTGEKIDDLEQFYPDRMAGRILGMGDVLSLVERAQERVQQEEQDALYASMSRGRLTLQDFAKQLSMVDKLGSFGQISKYMPGMAGKAIPADQIEQGEKQLKKFRAIISSMTLKERLNPAVLDGSRKQRIARGAGVVVSDIHVLLERFEQSQQYVKLFQKMNKFGRFFK